MRGPRARPIHRGSVLEAGGKPSTCFPPKRLVELTGNARCMRMPSYDFFHVKSKIFEKSQKSHISQILSKFVGYSNPMFANANR